MDRNLAQIVQELEALRRELHRVKHTLGSQPSPELQELSRRLDRLVVELMKARKGQRPNQQ